MDSPFQCLIPLCEEIIPNVQHKPPPAQFKVTSPCSTAGAWRRGQSPHHHPLAQQPQAGFSDNPKDNRFSSKIRGFFLQLCVKDTTRNKHGSSRVNSSCRECGQPGTWPAHSPATVTAWDPSSAFPSNFTETGNKLKFYFTEINCPSKCSRPGCIRLRANWPDRR